MRPLLILCLSFFALSLLISSGASAGTLDGVRSIKITNTREDWFYIEELEILNADEEDIASIDFGATATANNGPGFGSSVEGPIDDVLDVCCGTGWHSSDDTTKHVYILTFPSAQTISGEIRVWNRQDACCSQRLDGMLWEFLTGEDGEGDLIAAVQVDNLALDSGGEIDTDIGAAFTVPDPFTDADGDGLPGSWEFENDLDPESAEGADGANGDPDADGVTNIDEYNNGTKANKADTDEDGLSDGAETNTGIFVNGEDTGTDPLVVDTDKDGVPDGAETNTGTYVDESNTGTHPLLADSDGDGLSDGVETNSGEYLDPTDTGTDPNNKDTDGDSFADGLEVAAGSDPTDPASKPEIGGTIAGVVTVVITNTLPNWFYIEEIELLNQNGIDVASVDFGTTAEATPGTFGSSVEGAIDDATGNCCSTGWHSQEYVEDEPQTYTLMFPEPQIITGLARIWNRLDGCCADRLDGMLFEYFDANGDLIVSQEVMELAANSGGGISTEAGASFPLASGGSLGPFIISSILINGAANEVSITWNSSPAGSYAVDATTDIADPEAWIELDDGIQGEADSETTTFTEDFEALPGERYYRVRSL